MTDKPKIVPESPSRQIVTPSMLSSREDGKTKFEYEEKVREFTGLMFHCPKCDSCFHLHIASVELVPKDKVVVKSG